MFSGQPMRLPGFDHQIPDQKPCSLCQGIGTISATDIFCGAGGSSLGLTFVCCPRCGRQLIHVTQAVNHWDLAVQAHNANFPDADHDVHKVEAIPPSRFRSTDILWASPECVNHTACKGKRDDSPEAQRSRATFADIVRFTAYHRYAAAIVENVVEARLWCEHEDCACGAEFDAWYQAILDEGYHGEIIYFNSQFALPTPQSRDRMYVVFWQRGIPTPALRFRPLAWCTQCEQVVRGRQRWKRPSRGSAREHIHEWGRYGAQYLYHCPNPGCGQPVAPAVLGARTIIDFTLPITRIADKPPKHCKTCGKTHPVACNTRKRIRVGIRNIGEREPVAVQVGGHLYERDRKARVWSLRTPLRTITTTNTTALLTHYAEAAGGEGIVMRVGGQSPAERSTGEPISTITAHDRQIGLVMQTGGPTGSARNARTFDEPGATVMPQNHAALVMQNMAHNQPRETPEPLPPVTTGGNHMLVEFRGEHGGLRDIEEPAHTLTAQGTHHGLLLYNGVPGFLRPLGDTAGTITSRDKQSLVTPYYTSGVARDTHEPAATITTRDREALVLTDAEIDECGLRMFQWPELLRGQAMAYHPDGTPYELTAQRRNARGRTVELSNEQRTMMIGNAVSSPVATMLGGAVAYALLWPGRTVEELFASGA